MSKLRLVFTAGMGTLFEAFDFYLFSLFALALNYAFFGTVNKHSVLWIFIIFAVGYLARISGALIFGYWGDKIGRLYSFKKTVVIMALSSILIGFLPTYHQIGVLSIIFLMVLRFIQGVSYGGEESGATIVIIENFKKHQAVLVMCVALMDTVGVILAKLTYMFLSTVFNHQDMINYGWRVAYILGGILIFHSYFARKSMVESDVFSFSKKTFPYKNTIHEMFKNYKFLLLIGVLSVAGTELFWGVFMIYIPSYISLKYNSSEISSFIYYVILAGKIAGCFIGAIIADKTNIRVVYSVASIICVLLSLPLYIGLNSDILFDSYFLLLFLSIADGCNGVLMVLQLSKCYPIKYRYTLVSCAYAVAAFLFVGLPPFLFSYFTREDSLYYPLMIFAIVYAVQFIAVQILYSKTKKYTNSSIGQPQAILG